MTSAHIEISSTVGRTASQTRSAIDQLQASIENLEKLKESFDQMALGGDWTALAGYLGVTDAEAEEVYNLWGASVIELNGTSTSQLLSRCG